MIEAIVLIVFGVAMIGSGAYFAAKYGNRPIVDPPDEHSDYRQTRT